MVVRSYEDELHYLERLTDFSFRIKKGFQPNMKVNVLFILEILSIEYDNKIQTIVFFFLGRGYFLC